MSSQKTVVEKTTVEKKKRSLSPIRPERKPKQPSTTDIEWTFDILDVVDGDTLRIDFRGKKTYVRLLRINTPEVGRRGYQQATDCMRDLVGEGPVRIEFEIPGTIETDHYGRLLAYVYVGDVNVNLEMVRRGWSRFWPIFGKGRFAKEFQAAQKVAQDASSGLWGSGDIR